jgi:hypothetical protein
MESKGPGISALGQFSSVGGEVPVADRGCGGHQHVILGKAKVAGCRHASFDWYFWVSDVSPSAGWLRQCSWR